VVYALKGSVTFFFFFSIIRRRRPFNVTVPAPLPRRIGKPAAAPPLSGDQSSFRPMFRLEASPGPPVPVVLLLCSQRRVALMLFTELVPADLSWGGGPSGRPFFFLKAFHPGACDPRTRRVALVPLLGALASYDRDGVF